MNDNDIKQMTNWKYIKSRSNNKENRNEVVSAVVKILLATLAFYNRVPGFKFQQFPEF